MKETEEEGWREDEFEVADTGSRLPLASKLSETRPSLASYGRLCYVLSTNARPAVLPTPGAYRARVP